MNASSNESVSVALRGLGGALILIGLALALPGPVVAAGEGSSVADDPPDVLEKLSRCGPGDEVRLCRLAPEDFRAEAPDPERRHRVGTLASESCIRFEAPVGETSFKDRGRRIEVTLHGPRVYALFSRSCSWWDGGGEDPAFALRHEQIHFAIAEQAARLITARMGRTLRGYGKTEEIAMLNLQSRLRGLEEQADTEMHRQRAIFDALVRADPVEATHRKWVERYQGVLDVDL